MRYMLGFTLIELIIVLVIGAFLASMAYPAYVSYETRAERNRAAIALIQLAAKLELYFNERATYADATIASLGASALMQDIPYQLKINDADDQHFLIAAIPETVQAERDTKCGALTLTDTNQRGISGDGIVSECWK